MFTGRAGTDRLADKGSQASVSVCAPPAGDVSSPPEVTSTMKSPLAELGVDGAGWKLQNGS